MHRAQLHKPQQSFCPQALSTPELASLAEGLLRARHSTLPFREGGTAKAAHSGLSPWQPATCTGHVGLKGHVAGPLRHPTSSLGGGGATWQRNDSGIITETKTVSFKLLGLSNFKRSGIPTACPTLCPHRDASRNYKWGPWNLD